MSLAAESAGSYPKWPHVTWNLAQERWEDRRSKPYMVHCHSCGWTEVGFELAIDRLRMAAAQFAIEAVHWYECPTGGVQISFHWHPALFCRSYGWRHIRDTVLVQRLAEWAQALNDDVL